MAGVAGWCGGNLDSLPARKFRQPQGENENFLISIMGWVIRAGMRKNKHGIGNVLLYVVLYETYCILVPKTK